MTAAAPVPRRSPLPDAGPAVVRPARQVGALRADAVRAAETAAARTGKAPGTLIADTVDWAIGERDEAPFTGTRTAGDEPPSPAAIADEIAACVRQIRTPYSPQTREKTGRARHVRRVLEWLTGASDEPPTFQRGTQPGDITGGRGAIVRTDAERSDMAALARARRDAGADADGWASGPGWYAGVTAALDWTAGDRAAPPMSHPGTERACSHPASSGIPSAREITRERGQAEEHLEGGYRHGDHLPGYADGVLAAFRWLHGQTTQPPAR